MKFQDLTKSNSIKKDTVKKIKERNKDYEFIPEFNNGDKVKVIPKFAKHSTHLTILIGKELEVDYCKVADLGDMLVEVVYLKEPAELIANPYLVEHFKKA